MTGMWPFEHTEGGDLRAIRREFSDLVMSGGIAKGVLTQGRAAIDRALEPVADMLRQGGYIPHIDHFVPPGVAFADFAYYRTRLNEMIERRGNTV